MFVTDQDYKVVIGTTALSVITQADADNRARAESEAVEEISGYLRPKYDVAAIFAATGTSRNAHLVMITCDVALYHLCSSIGQKMGSEVRKERYDRAIKWLEGVNRGSIVPDLPLATDESGESATPIHFGSEPRHKNTW